MKKLALSLMVGLFAASFSGVAVAADDQGPFTSDNPTFARIVTLPFRAVTGGAGFGIGLAGGSIKGIVDGAREAGDWTADVHDADDGDTAEKVVRNVLFVPTWALGSVVLVPKNMLEEGLTTGWHLAGKGCKIWDRL